MRYLTVLILCTAALTGACVAPQSKIARADDAAIQAEAQAQREVAVQTIISRQRRLQDLAFPIWRSNADLCGDDTRVSTGAIVETAASYQKGDLASTFRTQLKLNDRPTVTHLIPLSPASGVLQIGDVLLQIGDVSISAGAIGISDTQRAVSRLKPDLPSIYRVERAGATLDLTVVPVLVCSYSVQYQPAAEINAYADGSSVFVTAGMMRFVESDAELAVVLGHELAHNALGHIDAKQVNAGIGLIFDILAAGAGVNTQGAFSKAGGNSYSQDFESEADYVGVYYLARANAPFTNASMFWRRMAAENPASIPGSYQATHPSTAQRFSQLEGAIKEIRLKQESGATLDPNHLSKETSPSSSGSNSSSTSPPGRPAFSGPR